MANAKPPGFDWGPYDIDDPCPVLNRGNREAFPTDTSYWVEMPDPPDEVFRNGDFVQGIGGRTWVGIEFGEPPKFRHSFFHYIDAIRHGNMERFLEIERESRDWWFVSLDRGAGAALHFACDHGQLGFVKFLVEERGAPVNQQDRDKGWTPLMRTARMAHFTCEPYMEIFEYLLSKGADPDILTYECWEDIVRGRVGIPQSIYDVCADKGRGWKPGRCRKILRSYVDKYKDVPKEPVYRYEGFHVAPAALKCIEMWKNLEPTYPPKNWRAPPEAGLPGCDGMRDMHKEPWKLATEDPDDGSTYLRPMTEEELDEQERNA